MLDESRIGVGVPQGNTSCLGFVSNDLFGFLLSSLKLKHDC
jgi:hypothetical protein